MVKAVVSDFETIIRIYEGLWILNFKLYYTLNDADDTCWWKLKDDNYKNLQIKLYKQWP